MSGEQNRAAVLEDLTLASTLVRRAAHWMTDASALATGFSGAVSERAARVSASLSEVNGEIAAIRHDLLGAQPDG